jgi:DNA-binding transcriptional ArsR family regulator
MLKGEAMSLLRPTKMSMGEVTSSLLCPTWMSKGEATSSLLHLTRMSKGEATSSLHRPTQIPKGEATSSLPCPIQIPKGEATSLLCPTQMLKGEATSSLLCSTQMLKGEAMSLLCPAQRLKVEAVSDFSLQWAVARAWKMVRDKRYRALEALVDKKDTVCQILTNIRANVDVLLTEHDQQQLLVVFEKLVGEYESAIRATGAMCIFGKIHETLSFGSERCHLPTGPGLLCGGCIPYVL